jgi:cytidyltransferase-like protein
MEVLKITAEKSYRLIRKLKYTRELIEIRKQLKKENKTIGLLYGCFDILHYGHIETFRLAKEKVDILIIGLESDFNINILKNKQRPIFKFHYRAEVLSELESIDYIFEVDGVPQDRDKRYDFYKELTRKVCPDFLVTNTTRIPRQGDKRNREEVTGIKTLDIRNSPMPITSSTEIIEKIINS